MILEYLILSSAILLLLVTISNVIFWPRVTKRYSDIPFSISVLIPARNEEINLPACFESLGKQGNSILEILVYDDHSTDQTSAVIERYTAIDGRIRRIESKPLPQGWCGKNFACSELGASASGEWILFLDADARLAENSLPRLLSELTGRSLTFLSCWPGIEMLSLPEKILMPMLNTVVFSLFPSVLSMLPRDELRSNPNLGLAHGACLLFHRESYISFGGHKVVKGELFEDTRLAQLWRQSGRNGLCLDGQEVVKLRMYSSFYEVWYGFQKNFYPAFKSEISYWLFLMLHIFVFFYPFVALSIYRSWLTVITIFSIITIRTLLKIRFNHSWLSVLLHPFSEFILILIGITSWAKCRIGNGVVWKGRHYQKAASQ